MIIFDLSQISIFSIMSASKTQGFEINESTVRHLVLNFIREFRAKHTAKFGDVVIATDGRKYWRRDNFPLYKYPRKKVREDSVHDWVDIKRCMGIVQQELRDIFPYPVIEVDSAEADDIIAILIEWSQTNDLNEDGLFSTPKPNLIISSDGDFFQLQRYKNVKQLSPMTMKLVKPEGNLAHFVCEHVLCGDATDGIPNILSPDEFFKMKEDGLVARQKPVTQGIKKFYYDQLDEHGKIVEWRSEEEKERFKRNFKLVHFAAIPKSVKQAVIETFLAQQGKTRAKLMTYMVKKQLTSLLPNIGDF